ncbi:MAG: hypothetical protein ACI81I_000295 [Arcobacteraceae bacterium]|jgi:hypothetical protein
MKIVISEVKNKKVKLSEVEYDGSILGLCKILKISKYRPVEMYEDDPISSFPGELIISKDYSYIRPPECLLSTCKINGISQNEDCIVAFCGIENILENKPLLSLEYLKSTIKYPTQDNPNMV